MDGEPCSAGTSSGIAASAVWYGPGSVHLALYPIVGKKLLHRLQHGGLCVCVCVMVFYLTATLQFCP